MIRFKLWYKNIFVGVLLYDSLNKILNDKPWSFYYSDEFKKQNQLSLLLEFPDVNMIYVSKDLFTIFKSRIPPPNRTDILQERTKKGIEDDDISMLIHFGHRCITDPFVLTFNPID